MKSILQKPGISARNARSDTDMLLAESNHRIANNLALVASMVRASATALIVRDRSGTPQQALIDAATRVETVAVLHRLLSEAPRFSAVSLGNYVKRVCDCLTSSVVGATTFDLTGADESCAVRADQALPLALIVHELVTNAIKYSHPTGVAGTIAVSCHRNRDGTLELAVTDDGVGLPESLDPDLDGTFGLQIVRALAGQLPAEVSFESGPLGLRCLVRVPAERAS